MRRGDESVTRGTCWSKSRVGDESHRRDGSSGEEGRGRLLSLRRGSGRAPSGSVLINEGKNTGLS